jgi:hypothetical protein
MDGVERNRVGNSIAVIIHTMAQTKIRKAQIDDTLLKRNITFVFDGAGSALTTAVSPARVRVPAGMTVNGWDIVSYDETGALLTGSIVVDIQSASTLGGSFSTIAGTEKPTL